MRAQSLRIITAALAAGLVMVSLVQPAPAEPRYGTVTAKSRYGSGTVTAPIRPGRYDYQVRLPGGTWIDCKRDCRETLREETVDFWKKREELLPRGR